MSVDLVYVVGGPSDDDRSDLRYSLRSFEANLGIDYRDVWVVGDVPEWFAGAKMPLEPKVEKFANQRASLTAYVNCPGAAEVMLLANDDFYCVDPVADPLPTYRNKNRLSGWATAEGKLNNWHRAVIATAEWTAEQTGTDPHIYEVHTPLLLDSAKLRDVLARYPDNQPFAVGEVYPIAGAGGVGSHAGNAKCKADDSFAHKLELPMPYLSGNPDSWGSDLGAWVRGQWPEPCRWER